MIPSGQPCTDMTNGEATKSKILHSYSLSSRMQTCSQLLDQSQVKEDEPSSIHSLSYMPPEYEVFKFHEECDEEELLGQENTKSNANVYERVEDEIHVGISTNAPILMELQSIPYELFKVQSNPPFEYLDQEDILIQEDSFGNYTKNAEINEVMDDLIKEAYEVNSHNVCIPDWCLKASNDDFSYHKSVYLNPLFSDERISTSHFQADIHEYDSMVMSTQVSSHHRLYEGYPIRGLIYCKPNYQRDL